MPDPAPSRSLAGLLRALTIRRLEVALLVGLLLSAQAARADDRWWGKDKAQHLAISAAMAGAWYGACSLLGDDPRPVRLVLASALALTPGLLKEIYDGGRAGRHFSPEDLTWDLVGVAAGSLLSLAIDLLLSRPRESLPTLPELWVKASGVALRIRF